MNPAGTTLSRLRPSVSTGASLEACAYHEAELRSMAAFRLREAAERLATLLAMTRSSRLRTDLRALRGRLLSEENDLLVGSADVRTTRRTGGVLHRAGF